MHMKAILSKLQSLRQKRKAIEAEEKLLRADILQWAQPNWLSAQEAKPTNSLPLDEGLKLTGVYWPKIRAKAPKGGSAYYEKALAVKVDGRAIPPKHHAKAAKLLAELEALGPGAVTVERGYRSSQGALTRALQAGASQDVIEDIKRDLSFRIL